MFKATFIGDFAECCEYTGLSEEFAEAFALGGHVGTLDKFLVLERAAGKFLILPYKRFSWGTGVSPVPAPSEPQAPPPKPIGRPCRVNSYTACISEQCDEDGFCRQTGEEFSPCNG